MKIQIGVSKGTVSDRYVIYMYPAAQGCRGRFTGSTSAVVVLEVGTRLEQVMVSARL